MGRPIVVAIGGDSGTGKSTLAAGIVAMCGPHRVVKLCLDDYHTFDRAGRAAAGLTALHPRANDFGAMERDLRRLLHGRHVTRPVYDHADGTFTAPRTVLPADIIIVEGLFPLATAALRAMVDVAVWLDRHPTFTDAWKIERDTAQRGYSEPAVRAEIAKRRADADAYVTPQGAYADLRVRSPRDERSRALIARRIVAALTATSTSIAA